MFIPLIIITVAFTFFSYFMRKDAINPVLIFNGLWSVILILFQLQVFQTIEISYITIGILYCMIISFNVGVMVCSYMISGSKRTKKYMSKTIKREYSLNERVFLILVIISIIVMLIDEIEIIKKLLSGMDFKAIMMETNGKLTVDIKGSLKIFLYTYFIHPMTYVVSPICAIQYLKYKKKKYLIINIIVSFLNVVHHGGRISVFIFALSYFTVYFFENRKNKLKIKLNISRKIKLVFSMFLFLSLVILLSASRGIEDIWISFYAYLICCIPLSTIYISSYLVRFIGCTHGTLTAYGFLYPLFGILRYFGVDIMPDSYNNAVIVKQVIENNYVSIGDYYATAANNFISAGAYPYIDGGYIFETIVFLIIGFLVAYMYNNVCREKKSDKSLTIYCFCVFGLSFSFMSMILTSYSYVLGLLMVVFILYRQKKEKE